MKKVVVIVLVMAVAVGVGIAAGSRGSTTKSPSPGSAVLSVDVVAASPGEYVGSRKVSGTVGSVDEPNRSFSLGCADACAGVSVTFDGDMPKAGSNVVVTGVIAEMADGTFRFTASQVQAQ